jgi:Na+-translocating ferredoxin:NAD+ oxidoreductase RnfC subunit
MGYPIEPHKVMRTLQMTGDARERDSLWAQYCCECNICSLIACPELLDPKNICVDAKALLKENNMSRTPAELDVLFRDLHPARRGREIPIKTVTTRLGLKPYDRYATFREDAVSVKKVCIPLDSHMGVPAEPVVSVGDSVIKGQLVADVVDDKLGCPAHASIDGTVSAIDRTGLHISANE